MAAIGKRVSDVWLKAVAPPKKGRTIYRDTLLEELGVKRVRLLVYVSHTGKRTFHLRYAWRGRQRTPAIGEYLDRGGMSLRAARALAEEMAQRIATGKDPEAAHTVAQLAEEWISWCREEVRGEPRRRSWADKERILRVEILPRLGDMAPDQVTVEEARDLRDSIRRRGAPGAANGVIRELSAFYGWLRSEKGLAVENPCRGLRDTYVADENPLSWYEVVALWQVWEELDTLQSRALQLLVLTGQRKKEVLAARWDELDETRCWLEIPAARMKRKTTHAVYVGGPLAQGVLREIYRLSCGSQWLFPSPGPRNAGAAPLGRLEGTIKKSAEAAGVRHLRAKDLRDTVGHRMLDLGVEETHVAAVCHHKLVGVTLVTSYTSSYSYRAQTQAAWETYAAELERRLVVAAAAAGGGNVRAFPAAG